MVSTVFIQNVSNSFLPTLHAQTQDKIEIMKILLEDAMDAVKKKDTSKAMTRLVLASQEVPGNRTLLLAGPKSSTLQLAKVFIDDALDAVKSREFDKALQRLILAEQQLPGSSVPLNQTQIGDNGGAVNITNPAVHNHNKSTIISGLTTNMRNITAKTQYPSNVIYPNSSNTNKSGNNFLAYKNWTSGIELRYPRSWNIQPGNSSNQLVISPTVSDGSVSLSLIQSRNEKNVTLDQFNNASIKYYNSTYVNTSRLMGNPTNNALLSGHKAYRFLIEYNQGVTAFGDTTDRLASSKFLILGLGTIIDDNIYHLRYSADASVS
jgi:hypothetical protein